MTLTCDSPPRRTVRAEKGPTAAVPHGDLPADGAGAIVTSDWANWPVHHRLTIMPGKPILTLILNDFAESPKTMTAIYFQLPDRPAATDISDAGALP